MRNSNKEVNKASLVGLTVLMCIPGINAFVLFYYFMQVAGKTKSTFGELFQYAIYGLAWYAIVGIVLAVATGALGDSLGMPISWIAIIITSLFIAKAMLDRRKQVLGW